MRTLFILLFLLAITIKASAQGYNTGLPMPGLPVSVGPKTMAGSTSVTFATDQTPLTVSATITGTVTQAANTNGKVITATVTASESNYAAPANAVGTIIESESTNLVNIRYGISNSAASILGATTGVLMEPGRDSGYIPVGSGSYVHLIGVSAGNEAAEIQWILSQ